MPEFYASLDKEAISRAANHREGAWFEFTKIFQLDPTKMDSLAISVGSRSFGSLVSTYLPYEFVNNHKFLDKLRDLSPQAKSMGLGKITKVLLRSRI